MSGLSKWLLVIVVAALVTVMMRSVSQSADFTPIGDTALVETFTRLAADGTLLLGSPSGSEWHHPGPLYFFAIAPAYELGGGRTAGLNAGALLLNLTALAFALWFIARLASPVLGITLSLSLVFFIARVPGLLVSPLNTHVAVFAALAMLAAAAAAVSGEGVALPAVALFASLAAQTHRSLLPLAIIVVLAAEIAFTLSAVRRGTPPDRIARAVAMANVLTLIVWIPPLYQQLTGTPGNLGLLWQDFLGDASRAQTLGDAVLIWAQAITAPLQPGFHFPSGVGLAEPAAWAPMAVGLELPLLAMSAMYSRRSGRMFDAALSALLLLASLASIWSAVDAPDLVVLWIACVGALNVAIVVAFMTNVVLGARDMGLSRIAPAVACAGALVALVWAGATQIDVVVRASRTPDMWSSAADELATTLRREIRERHLSRPLIRFDQNVWEMAAGVVLRLQKAGIAVAIDDAQLAMYTPAFAATERERAQITIVGSDEHARRVAAPADTVIGSARDLLFAHLTTR